MFYETQTKERLSSLTDNIIIPRIFLFVSCFFEIFNVHNLHYEKFSDGTVKCIEDEIPFDVPDGWAWCRLGNISSVIQYGLNNSAEQEGTHRFLRITDIQNGMVDWENVPFTTPKDVDAYLLDKGDILFARTGATVGKSFIVSELPYPSVYASYLIRIRLLGDVYPEYIYRFFNSKCYWEQITDKSVGVGQPNCNGTSLKELFIPLPPIEEQPKIISKSEIVLNHVQTIEYDKLDLTDISSSIKAKILDLAIRGKLVPQNQDDEPASVLLEHIKAEKEELIKQGKIKRDKKESVIFKGEDNSYYRSTSGNVELFADFTFELPDGWEWCNLSMISQIITKGTTPRGGNVAYVDKGIGFLRAENVSGFGKLDTTDLKYVTKDVHNNFLKRSILCANDILITIAGTLGRTAIVPETELPLNTNQAVSIVRPINYKLLNLMYVIYAVNASEISKKLLSQSVEMAIPNLSLDNISNCTFPLPPLAEQKRIVDAIETAFEHFDNILNNL